MAILFSIIPMLCLYYSIYFLWVADNFIMESSIRLRIFVIMVINLGVFPLISMLIARKLGLISEYMPRRYNKDSIIINLMMGIFLFWTYYVCKNGDLWSKDSIFPKIILGVLTANCLALPLSRFILPDLRIITMIIGLFFMIFNIFQNHTWQKLGYTSLVLVFLGYVLRTHFLEYKRLNGTESIDKQKYVAKQKMVASFILTGLSLIFSLALSSLGI